MKPPKSNWHLSDTTRKPSIEERQSGEFGKTVGRILAYIGMAVVVVGTLIVLVAYA